MKRRTKTIAATLVLGLAASAVGAAVFVYSGIYDISAVEQHTAPVFHLLDFAMRRSVLLRAADIEVPDLTGAERIRSGFMHYRAHCVVCHGAPGVAPGGLAMGMTPVPANLVSTAREWDAAQLYWVVRNGIKMSGMPAWRYRLNNEEIWDIVAFVERMPAMSPQDFQEWNERAEQVDEQKSQQKPLSPAAVQVREVTLGDPDSGRRALQQYLCATCHQIPGIVGANRHVGPPLMGIATRTYIAGVLPNTPGNMVHWIQHPTRVDPLSAMPDLGVTEQDARDIAAYLYTLEEIE
jgi:mono/diheme cytochrome c family protein